MKRMLVSLVILTALSGDALAWVASSACGPRGAALQETAACCCGPESCPSGPKSQPTLNSACCDMRHPASGPESPTMPRDTAASTASAVAPAFTLSFIASAGSATPVVPCADSPVSLHSPPLYALFRSYRI